MAERKPKCPVMVSTTDGACYKPAVQRVLMPGLLVTHRCTEHKVAKAEAKRNKWSLFDLAAEQ